MSDNLLKENIRTIYNECMFLSQGIVQDEPLEERMEREFGTFGAYYAMPFIFDRIEQGDKAQDVIDILFPENAHTVTQDQLVQYAAQFTNLEEDEEVLQPSVTPVVEVAPAPKPEVKVEPKPRQGRASKSGSSLSSTGKVIYVRLYSENPNIRNADAQRTIATELGVAEDRKKCNSIRALVVKWKRELRG